MKKKISFVLSDESRENSRGWSLTLSGGNLERFRNNPVLLYDHNSEHVIGRWENLRIENNQMLAEAVFDEKDNFALEIKRKVEDGFLKGCSVGLRPIKMKQVDEKYYMTQWELLEASIVAVPSDASALVLFDENGVRLSETEVREFLKLNNIQQITRKMEKEELKLSEKTVTSLGIKGPLTAEKIETAVEAKDAEIASLKAEKNAQEEATRKEFLAAAVADGKITAEELEYCETLAATNFKAVKAMINARPQKASVSLSAIMQGNNVTGLRADWDYMRWMKEDPKGLQRLKTENPTEFERIRKTLIDG
jgi:HK97 family phage prohead protease